MKPKTKWTLDLLQLIASGLSLLLCAYIGLKLPLHSLNDVKPAIIALGVCIAAIIYLQFKNK